MAQIKELFKDSWETIPGNSDTILYLGGNEQSTHKYISEALGKATIDTKTHGQTKGKSGSYSTNFQMSGRELLTPDEVLRLPPDQVLIFIRGQKVMRAKRFDYSLHPDYKKLKSRKAILHEPDWKSSQASSVSASGVSSPSVTAAIPAEKANVGSQKKPPGKPPRSTTRKVVNADELF